MSEHFLAPEDDSPLTTSFNIGLPKLNQYYFKIIYDGVEIVSNKKHKKLHKFPDC